MDKPLTFISLTGEEMSKQEVEEMFQSFLKPIVKNPEHIKHPPNPPRDFREFEDRMMVFEEKLRMLLFGLTYDIGSGKTLKREKSPETMVDALCSIDKHLKEHGSLIFNEQLSSFLVLALALERDAPFIVCEDVYLLGFTRDRSGISLPQKNKIAIQAAAQVLWYQEKNKIPTIEEMTAHLQNNTSPLYSLLQIDRFNNPRTIKDLISEVFPIAHNLRKGRPSKYGLPEHYFNDLVCIPEIFFEDGTVINLLKFRFAIRCLSRILKTLNHSVEQVKRSSVIQLYKVPVSCSFCVSVDHWIDQAMNENGSIFDQ